MGWFVNLFKRKDINEIKTPEKPAGVESIDASALAQPEADLAKTSEKPVVPVSNNEYSFNSTIQKISTPTTSNEKYILGNVEWDYVSIKEELSSKQYVVLDIETTGFSPVNDRIIEIGAVKCFDDKIVDRFESLVNPEMEITAKITSITGITNEQLISAPKFNAIAQQLLDFIDDLPVVAHNASFDANFIDNAFEREGYSFEFACIDTLAMARDAYPKLKNHKLATLIEALELSNSKQEHRALNDAELTQKLYVKCRNKLIDMEKRHFQKIIKKAERAPEEEKGYEYNYVGMEYESYQDVDNAIIWFEKAISEKVKFSHPYSRLAIIYRRQKKYEDEIRICNAALAYASKEDEKQGWLHRIDVASKRIEKQSK